ncbi:MAG: thioredoxin family protein [Planctomycetota bacterium]|jgi:hypothetical protein
MAFTDAEWEAGVAWETYLAGVEKHRDLWHHHYSQAELPENARARLGDLPGPRRVLVLSEDWCGDAARSVPWIVRAAEAAPGVSLRLIDIAGQDELMLRHLSKGARAIPVAIVQDEGGRELGWWGPRPAALQAMLRQKLADEGPPGSGEFGKFYAPIMGWYKKDGGRTILDEFLLLLERGGEPR